MQRLIVLVACVAAVSATSSLGWWQLERGRQRSATQQALQQREKMAALPAGDLATKPAQLDEQRFRRIVLEGRWLPERTVFLANRQMDGRPGFYVVTPLVLADGSAVLVQRGWVPRDFANPMRVPPVPVPEGEVEVAGRVAAPPPKLFELDAVNAVGSIRQNLDLDAFAREVGMPLRPLSIEQTGEGSDGLRRNWPRRALDPSRNYGYAFQWFAIAALIGCLYVWFGIVKPSLRRA